MMGRCLQCGGEGEREMRRWHVLGLENGLGVKQEPFFTILIQLLVDHEI